MNLVSLSNIIKQSSATNKKQEILRQYENVPFLSEIFIPYLDKNIKYGFTKFDKNLLVCYGASEDLSEFIEFLSNQSGNMRSNDSIYKVCAVLYKLTLEYQEFCILILTNKLKIGLNAKLWNKAFPENCIHLHSCMLATPQNSIKKWHFPYIIQTKLDGVRAQLLDDILTLRSGKKIQIHNIHSQYPFPIDGELIYKDDINTRTNISGLINKILSGKSSKLEEQDITFIAFDVIRENIGYNERFMNEVYHIFDQTSTSVKLIPSKLVTSMDEVDMEFNKNLDLGNEGVILRSPDSIWEGKRSKNLIKFKAEKIADLKVVKLLEGNGKFSGTLGSVSLESSDGIVKVKVGSGFTDIGRDFVWKNQDKILHKIIECKYNAVISKKGSKVLSLFLPVLGSVRVDKTVANSSVEILGM